MSAAGKLRERVTVYAVAPTVSDGMGGTLPTDMIPLATLFAQVQMLRPKEYLIDNKISYIQPYKITVRYNASLDFCTQLVWNGKTINVTSVTADERKTETYLYGANNS